MAWVEELKRTLDIPASIQAAGVPEAEFLARLDAIAEAAFDDQCTGANPRFPLVAEIRQLLLDSYYGRAYAEGAERAPEAAEERKPVALVRSRCSAHGDALTVIEA